MKFDAAALADQELVVLESTLRVQLAVAKHVRAQQLTTAIGGALLTGGVSAILSGPSIVCSTVLRRKCQRRHRACCRELVVRNVALAPIQEKTFSRRALALSIASGLTCCVLGVALDVLVDEAVLQVIAFFFSSLVEDHVTDRTTGFVHAHAAELVGRDHVYVLDTNEPFALFGDSGSSSSAGDGKSSKRKHRFRPKSLVDMPRRAWKNASWSFSSTEMQAKIRDAKQVYRTRRSLHESFNHHDDEDIITRRGAENWAFLFAQDRSAGAAGDDDEARVVHEHETLFGCRVRSVPNAMTTLFGTSLSEFAEPNEEEVDLVRSDAFSLFGDCYVVRVRQASTTGSPRRHEELSGLKAETYEALFESTEPFHDAEERNTVVHVTSCEPGEELFFGLDPGSHRQNEKSLLFTGDEASCAFWDGIWCQDDKEEDNEDTEYGVEVWALDDDVEDEAEDKEPEYGVEVWEYNEESESLFPTEPLASSPLSPLGYPKHAAATATTAKMQVEFPRDASSLFGSPKRLNSGVTAAYSRYEQHEMVDDLEPHQLFG